MYGIGLVEPRHSGEGFPVRCFAGEKGRDRALKTGSAEIARLLARPLEELVAEADSLRRLRHGDGVWIRGLLEFTNRCTCNCLYCGLRAANGRLGRYSLTEEEILLSVRAGFARGLGTFVLQGGEDPDWTTDRLCRLVEAVKVETEGRAAVTLSCGIKSRGDYRRLAACGADRYLLRFETADPILHERLRGGISLRRRLQALDDLREEGFELGSGFMVGLPGETEAVRVANLELCRDLALDMVGIGPFIANPDTPLAGEASGTLEATVRMTAALRLLLPDANIPATTAAGSLFSQGREAMLGAGANVLMPNVTPLAYRERYLLYPGKDTITQDGIQELEAIAAHLEELGRRADLGRGDSPSRTRTNKKQMDQNSKKTIEKT